MRAFKLEDIINLLRAEVKRAGGQVAWTNKTGVNRTNLNRVLNGRIAPTKTILKALKLRTVIVSKSKPPDSK